MRAKHSRKILGKLANNHMDVSWSIVGPAKINHAAEGNDPGVIPREQFSQPDGIAAINRRPLEDGG